MSLRLCVEKNGRKNTFRRRRITHAKPQSRKEKNLREDSISLKPLRLCAFAWKKMVEKILLEEEELRKQSRKNCEERRRNTHAKPQRRKEKNLREDSISLKPLRFSAFAWKKKILWRKKKALKNNISEIKNSSLPLRFSAFVWKKKIGVKKAWKNNISEIKNSSLPLRLSAFAWKKKSFSVKKSVEK